MWTQAASMLNEVLLWWFNVLLLVDGVRITKAVDQVGVTIAVDHVDVCGCGCPSMPWKTTSNFCFQFSVVYHQRITAVEKIPPPPFLAPMFFLGEGRSFESNLEACLFSWSPWQSSCVH